MKDEDIADMGKVVSGDTVGRENEQQRIVFATGGMGAWLWHHGLLDKPVFVAEQGHFMERPGQASVEAVGPRNAIETVKVGGNAVTVVRGTLRL